MPSIILIDPPIQLSDQASRKRGRPCQAVIDFEPLDLLSGTVP